MPSLKTIQTGVPEAGMASSMSPEKPKEKKKRSFDIDLPKINLPNIDINLPTFNRNRSPKPKILKKGGKGFMSGKKSGRLKRKRKFSGRRR